MCPLFWPFLFCWTCISLFCPYALLTSFPRLLSLFLSVVHPHVTLKGFRNERTAFASPPFICKITIAFDIFPHIKWSHKKNKLNSGTHHDHHLFFLKTGCLWWSDGETRRFAIRIVLSMVGRCWLARPSPSPSLAAASTLVTHLQTPDVWPRSGCWLYTNASRNPRTRSTRFDLETSPPPPDYHPKHRPPSFPIHRRSNSECGAARDFPAAPYRSNCSSDIISPRSLFLSLPLPLVFFWQ